MLLLCRLCISLHITLSITYHGLHVNNVCPLAKSYRSLMFRRKLTRTFFSSIMTRFIGASVYCKSDSCNNFMKNIKWKKCRKVTKIPYSCSNVARIFLILIWLVNTNLLIFCEKLVSVIVKLEKDKIYLKLGTSVSLAITNLLKQKKIVPENNTNAKTFRMIVSQESHFNVRRHCW